MAAFPVPNIGTATPEAGAPGKTRRRPIRGGVRLWEVASLSPRRHGVREIPLPYLEDLFEVTRPHVLRAVPDENEAVLIGRLTSGAAIETAYRFGGRAPLRSTAVGPVLLAGADASFQEATISQSTDLAAGVDELPKGRCPLWFPTAPLPKA